ncbi:MAG: hypothetical protein MZW92_05940 [Comamonadaceae bacterium]|nr:hypothetical protein [Comamonadaceae bacterium]
MEGLFQAADRVRKECVGDEIFLRGIIEFSELLQEQLPLLRTEARQPGWRSATAWKITRSLALQRPSRSRGCSTVVLPVREKTHIYTRERMRRIIARIRDETGLAITLSIGQRPYEDYKAFREAGADRYLLRHETANPALYCEAMSRQDPSTDRIQCLKWLRELDYEVGMGCMVGLPEQTVEDLADDVLLIKGLGADMIGIGPFIPHEETPLKDHAPGRYLTLCSRCSP